MAKAQILVVEDESIVAMDAKRMLERIGYAVPAVVASGEMAIQKTAEAHPDLVLMDIRLKGDIDGVEAAEQIRTRFHVPVIYLTAYGDKDTLQRAKITEPYGYILKPFQERELYTTIEMALYRHKMERKLQESEQWLSTTLRSIGDAVIATDTKGRVTFMNPVAQSLTGWKQEEAVGKPLTDVLNVISEEVGEPVEDPVAKVIREGTVAGLGSNTILIARDGARLPIDDSGAPIRDDSGNLLGIVLVFRDITERRRMEEDLQKSQRLESIGILAGGIAHDFNNVLTAILGNVSLATIYTDPNKISERLAEAEKACMQAKDLTQRLLTFSVGGEPIKKTASIAELLRNSASLALSGSNVRCEFSLPDDLWPVEIDEGQMNQVINNLIINANQAMPEGGVVKVRAENVTLRTESALPLPEGEYAKISIEDQGIGIPKDHLQKIFDPYFTTKQRGSGLGLTTTYSIIRKHDGYIVAESQAGVGTTFHIHVPASPEKTLVQKEKAEKVHITGKGRILIMDDEEFVREVASDMLTNMGYEITVVEDGAEATRLYKQAKESGQLFDAVIIDLTVPGGMGGRETIRKLQEIDSEVRAIVSSGYSNNPIMASFQEYGFKGVIAKPYGTEELSEVLHKVMLDA